MAEIVRLRKFEKPPEQLLKDLAESEDWESIIVIGQYKKDGQSWIDCFHNDESATHLTGMLMRSILIIDQHE